MNPTTVLIVDAHPLVRVGLTTLIACDPTLRLLGQAGDAEQALELCAASQPQLILMGLSTCGRDAADVLGRLRQRHPPVKIVIFGDLPPQHGMHGDTRAGADAYLPKNAPVREIMQCIAVVLQGRRHGAPQHRLALASTIEVDRLTPREVDILVRLATGMSNKVIANAAGIGVGTVKFHVKSIMSKLHASSRTEAAAVAAKRGLVRLN
jgi:two-component system NarL family response regulator